MLQLNRDADYAIRLMLEVSAPATGRRTTAEVASRQDIPYEFLRKIAQTLVASGLLASERGVHGGLSLGRPAEEITVLDIVRAFGALSLNRCTAVPPRCDRSETCPAQPVWVEAQSQIEKVLGGARLSDLVERAAIPDRQGLETMAPGTSHRLRRP